MLSNASYFNRQQVPTVFSTAPSASMERGETTVAVTGQGFVNLPTLACRFGMVTRPVQFVSSELILCPTPSASEPGTVHLEVTVNGVDYSAQEIPYTFLSMVTLRRVTPHTGPVGGGSTVQVEGSGFDQFLQKGLRLHCRWEMPGPKPRDILETRAAISADWRLACVSPAAGEAGR